MATVAKYDILLELDTRVGDSEKNINKVEKNLADVENRAKGIKNQFTQVRKTLAAAFAVGTIVAAGKALGQVVSKSINVAGNFELAAENLSTLVGGMTNARNLLDEIDKRSIPTPFSPGAFREATTQLLNYGVAQENVLDDLDRIAELSGGSEQKLLALADAYGKANARVKVTNETLELFANNGVPILDILAKNLNKTKEEIIDLASKGQINFTKLRDAIKGVTDTGGQFDGSLDRMSKTLNGLRSTLQGVRERLLRVFGQRFLDQAKRATIFMTDFLKTVTGYIEVPLSEKLQKERVDLNVLVGSIGEANTSQGKRNELIGKLQKEYPFFLDNLNAETVTNRELRDRLTEVNDLYIKRIALQSQQEEVEKLLEKSGKALARQAEDEIALRREIIKIADEFDGLQIDQINTPLEVQIRLIDSFLKQNAEFQTSIKDGTVRALNDEAKALTRLEGVLLDTSFSKGKLKGATDELSESEQKLKDLEDVLGTSLAKINELFTAGTEVREEETKTTGKYQNALQKLNSELKKLEDRRVDLLAAGKFGEAQEVQRRIVLIKDEIEKLQKAIDDLTGKTLRENLTKISVAIVNAQAEARKIATSTSDFLRGLANESSEFAIKAGNDLISFAVGVNKAIIEKTRLEREIDARERIDDEKVLSNTIGQIQAQAALESLELNLQLAKTGSQAWLEIRNEILRIKQELQGLRDESFSIEFDTDQFSTLDDAPETFLGKLFGLDRDLEQELNESIKSGVAAVKDGLNQVFAAEVQDADRRIKVQEQRVNKARDLAEKGNVEALELEEERLSKLQNEREKALQRQQQLAAIEIAINKGVAVSDGIKAISNAVAQPFPSNLVAVPLVLGLLANVASGGLAIANAFDSVPSFFKGIERTTGGNLDGNGGFNAILHRNERVVPEKDNKKVGYDFPNEKLPDAVDIYKKYKSGELSSVDLPRLAKVVDINPQLISKEVQRQVMKVRVEGNDELKRELKGLRGDMRQVQEENVAERRRNTRELKAMRQDIQAIGPSVSKNISTDRNTARKAS